MPNEQLRVLVADDEFWIRENLRTIIDWPAFGLELLPPAADGEDALDKMAQMPADILITDINMPYLSGVELMRHVRERWPQTVILVLSGYSDFEYVHQALLAGALDYILKPINRSKLVEALQRAIEQALQRTRERQEQAQRQTQLKMAATMVADRDFSQWLHDLKHQERFERVEARLFDYEASFSSYRVVLIKIPAFLQRLGTDALPASVAEASYRIKTIISGANADGGGLVIHDQYHTSHFLLVTEMDEPALRKRLPELLRGLEAQTGATAMAMVSESYFSFRDLRKAYDDVRRAMLARSFNGREAVGFAQATEQNAMQQRLSAELVRQLEHAAKTQQRSRFEALIAQSGLYDCAHNGWTVMELLHSVNRIAWILRHNAEDQMNPVQLMAVDNLLELLLDCVDRLALDELPSLLAQLQDEYFAVAEPSGQSDTMRQIVARARDYIDKHYSETISLSMLAKRFSIDDSYLSRTFKQQVGMNLMLYLANTRIAQAKRLLKQHALSITDVAQLVGYDDYAYFSRVFKKMEGKSPRAYREEESS